MERNAEFDLIDEGASSLNKTSCIYFPVILKFIFRWRLSSTRDVEKNQERNIEIKANCLREKHNQEAQPWTSIQENYTQVSKFAYGG